MSTLSRRRLVRSAVGLLVASASGALATACQQWPFQTSVQTYVPKVERAPGEVVFAPPPTLEGFTRVTKAAQPLAEALGTTTGLKVKVLVPSDLAMALLWLREGSIDIAWLGPFFYIKAKESFGAELLLRTLVQGRPSENSVIVTRKETGITALDQLKGRTIAATDAGDAVGWIYPAAEIKKLGIDPFRDLDVEFRADEIDALITLLSKDKDGKFRFHASFTAERAMNSKEVADKLKMPLEKIKEETNVLKKIEGVPTAVLVARPGLERKTVETLRTAIIGLKEKPDLLKPFGVDGFTEGKDADFNELRERAKMLGMSLKD